MSDRAGLLTPGCVRKFTSDAASQNLGPAGAVVQVRQRRVSVIDNLYAKQYTLLISDSWNSLTVLLHPDSNHLIESDEIGIGQMIRITSYTVDRKRVELTQVVALKGRVDKIGNPQFLTSTLEPSTSTVTENTAPPAPKTSSIFAPSPSRWGRRPDESQTVKQALMQESSAAGTRSPPVIGQQASPPPPTYGFEPEQSIASPRQRTKSAARRLHSEDEPIGSSWDSSQQQQQDRGGGNKHEFLKKGTGATTKPVIPIPERPVLAVRKSYEPSLNDIIGSVGGGGTVTAMVSRVPASMQSSEPISTKTSASPSVIARSRSREKMSRTADLSERRDSPAKGQISPTKGLTRTMSTDSAVSPPRKMGDPPRRNPVLNQRSASPKPNLIAASVASAISQGITAAVSRSASNSPTLTSVTTSSPPPTTPTQTTHTVSFTRPEPPSVPKLSLAGLSMLDENEPAAKPTNPVISHKEPRSSSISPVPPVTTASESASKVVSSDVPISQPVSSSVPASRVAESVKVQARASPLLSSSGSTLSVTPSFTPSSAPTKETKEAQEPVKLSVTSVPHDATIAPSSTTTAPTTTTSATPSARPERPASIFATERTSTAVTNSTGTSVPQSRTTATTTSMPIKEKEREFRASTVEPTRAVPGSLRSTGYGRSNASPLSKLTSSLAEHHAATTAAVARLLHENDMTQRLLTCIRSFDSICSTSADSSRFLSVMKDILAFFASLSTISKEIDSKEKLSELPMKESDTRSRTGLQLQRSSLNELIGTASKWIAAYVTNTAATQTSLRASDIDNLTGYLTRLSGLLQSMNIDVAVWGAIEAAASRFQSGHA